METKVHIPMTVRFLNQVTVGGGGQLAVQVGDGRNDVLHGDKDLLLLHAEEVILAEILNSTGDEKKIGKIHGMIISRGHNG